MYQACARARRIWVNDLYCVNMRSRIRFPVVQTWSYRDNERMPRISSRASHPKGRVRLEEVLDAAEDLLRRRGSEGLSVRAVAQRVGISVGNLQYYIPTRARLLDAVFQRAAERYRSELSGVMTSTDPRENLSRLVDYWLATQHRADQSLFWHLWAISAHDDAARATMTLIYAEVSDTLVQLMRQVHGDLSSGEAAIRAALITALIDGSGLFVGYGRVPDRRLVRLHKEVRARVLEWVDRPPSRPATRNRVRQGPP